MKKSLTAIMLAAVLITASLTPSCAGTESVDEPGTTIQSTEGTSAAEQGVEDIINAQLETLAKKDYGGKSFTFLVASETLWGHEQIDTEDINGEPINDEIYERNRRIEERYNVKIESVQENFSSIGKKISTLVQSGDTTYDVMLPRINAGVACAQQGQLVDLLTLDYVSADKPWWDGNIVKDLSIGDKCFFLTGDIHLYANDATHIVLFNKKLAEDYNLGNFYTLVESGDWTFEKFRELALQVVSDINGDGAYLWGDRFGLQHADYAIPALLSAAASPIFKKNDDGSIEFNIASERFEKAFTYISALMTEGNISLNMQESSKYKIPAGDFSHEWYEAMDGDQALFMIGVLDYMNIFKNVERSFGILPLPKLDKTQEKYISPVMADAMAICVPVTNPDPDMTGLLLEAMAVESYGKLRNAYYDITLQRKRSRDDESAGMLDIIFSSRTYPLDMVYNWSSMSNEIINAVKKGNGDLASIYEKKEAAVSTAISKSIDEYKS